MGGALGESSAGNLTDRSVDRGQLVDTLRWGLVDESQLHGQALASWQTRFVEQLGRLLGAAVDLDVASLRVRCAEVLGVSLETFVQDRLNVPAFLRGCHTLEPDEGVTVSSGSMEPIEPTVVERLDLKGRLFEYLMIMRRQEPDLSRPGRRAEREIELVIPLARLLCLPVPQTFETREGFLEPHQWRTYIMFLRAACADILELSVEDFLKDDRFPRLLTKVGIKLGQNYSHLNFDGVVERLPLLFDLWELGEKDELFQPFTSDNAAQRIVFRNEAWAQLHRRWMEEPSEEGGMEKGEITSTPLLFETMPLASRLHHKANLVRNIIERLGISPEQFMREPCFPRFLRFFPVQDSPIGLIQYRFSSGGNQGVGLSLEQIREDYYDWPQEEEWRHQRRRREAFAVLAQSAGVAIHPEFVSGTLDSSLLQKIQRQIVRSVCAHLDMSPETFRGESVRAPRFLKAFA